jgi:hypothetical protein
VAAKGNSNYKIDKFMPQLRTTQLDSLIAGVNSLPIGTYAKILNDRYTTPNGDVIDMDLLESWRITQARRTELEKLLITEPKEEGPQPPPPPPVNICSDLQKIERLSDFINLLDSQNVSLDVINECLGLESSDVENIRNHLKTPTLKIWDDEDLPPVPQDSTDIFFIGTPKSAKTCVIAATLNNLAASGRKVITGDSSYRIGHLYQTHLIRCMRLHVMPERTADDMSNYMSLGVMHDVNTPNQIHKWNFIEMSGERLQNTFEGLQPDINPGNWLDSKNRKVLNFVIDCDYDPAKQPQDEILNAAYRQLNDWNVFERTDVINFLVNKIDVKTPGDPKQYVKELVETKYSALLNTLKQKQKGGIFSKKKFVINVIPISIGDGFTLGGSYMKTSYDHYINGFIDELTASTSYRKIN